MKVHGVDRVSAFVVFRIQPEGEWHHLGFQRLPNAAKNEGSVLLLPNPGSFAVRIVSLVFSYLDELDLRLDARVRAGLDRCRNLQNFSPDENMLTVDRISVDAR